MNPVPHHNRHYVRLSVQQRSIIALVLSGNTSQHSTYENIDNYTCEGFVVVLNISLPPVTIYSTP